MAEIHPFRGIRYNQQLVNDLSRVICAPDDIITPKLQEELYRRSEHNFVRLNAPPGSSDGGREDAKWQRAAATLDDWLEKRILQIDDVPAIYLHDHYFAYLGKKYTRRGIIVIVRLEEWDRMVVRRHEEILPELKKSRISQIRTLKACTSPLLALFEDQEGRFSSLLSTAELGRPIINLSSNTDGRHKVWAITSPKLISQIRTILSKKPLCMADGHHRYEAALAYRAERGATYPSISRDDPCNFVMMTLSPLPDPGLIVLPFHRLIRGMPDSVLGRLLAGLKAFFEVEEWSLDMPNIWQEVDSLLVNAGGPDKPEEVVIVLFGLVSDKLVVLRVRDFAAVARAMPACQSESYKRLDVSIADHLIIEKLLQITSDKKEKLLAFKNDRVDAVREVLNGQYQLALLLRAARIEQILKISDAGETMPAKSNRFYPKPPTGFVFYRLV